MKTVVLYLLPDEINDATSYYVDIIIDAFKSKGVEVVVCKSVKSINNNDTVLVITVKSFFKVFIRNRKQKILMWFQGIMPEEGQLLFKDHWSGKVRYYFWSILEKLALKKSRFNFFVSKSMVAHYNRKYSYTRNNYYIMPCFNLPLNMESFIVKDKYEKPTFVYSGSLSRWQCIEKTLSLYKVIEDYIPESKLVLLTSEVEKGKCLAEQYNIKNIEVKYVPVNEVGKELMKYKYGFLLREDHIVNQVATPTKLNSYLASGVIPIYSDVIHDFAEEFKNIDYMIKIADMNDHRSILSAIEKYEHLQINGENVKCEFSKIFYRYYSRTYHINELTRLINESKLLI